MPKLREHATVPPIDGARLGQLATIFDASGVVSASLIGSQATGTAGPLSDVDLGVWLQPGLVPAARSELASNLRRSIVDALGSDEVDLVVLNEATPLLRHRAIRDGVRLVERDRDERIRLEARALLDYLDTARLREILAAGIDRRLREGRFGRR